MKTVRIIKKSKNLFKSVESQSRQIITNIYSDSNNDQLQLSVTQWNTAVTTRKVQVENPVLVSHDPHKNLLVLLQHLQKDYYLNACSFIFVSSQSIHIVYRDKNITIKKIKPQKSKLKYWLSDIYFTRLRSKLAEQLLDHSFKAQYQKKIVHFNQEKQYMPSHVSGKKQKTPLVRELTISRSSIYRKQGESERQQFCQAYYVNGTQQLFSFSEILSFVQYPFNLNQISYIKILPKQKSGMLPVSSEYSKKYESSSDNSMIWRLKRLHKSEQGWAIIRDEVQDLKNKFIKSQQYRHYCHLLMLQIISFLQVKHFIEIRQIKLEWTITNDNNVILSNAQTYRFVFINRIPQSPEGLVTLYEKCRFDRSKTTKFQGKEDSRYISNKSEGKQIIKSTTTAKFPLISWRKKNKKDVLSSKYPLKMVKKANTCALIAKKDRLITQ